MPNAHDQYREVETAALEIPNLELTGPVPYQKVNSYYARSRLLVNTSSMEGFPNSFLQAWIRGVPVISTFDPGNLIIREGLGQFVRTESELKAAVVRFISDRQFATACGSRACSYAERTHGVSRLGKELVRLIAQLQTQ
jgi:glycosyltransferase involved in cell wall biosynthesis